MQVPTLVTDVSMLGAFPTEALQDLTVGSGIKLIKSFAELSVEISTNRLVLTIANFECHFLGRRADQHHAAPA